MCYSCKISQGSSGPIFGGHTFQASKVTFPLTNQHYGKGLYKHVMWSPNGMGPSSR